VEEILQNPVYALSLYVANRIKSSRAEITISANHLNTFNRGQSIFSKSQAEICKETDSCLSVCRARNAWQL